MKKLLSLLLLISITAGLLCSCLPDPFSTKNPTEAYKVVNNNVPYFTEGEITASAYEYYSELDSLGRCGVVHASIGIEIMPKKGEERGSISSVTPSGWCQAEYPTDLVDGGFLYNRAHLIGWQLSAENANRKNLITGTRYFNVDGMLPFENMVADYIRETKNHVMYRVTPDFQGTELVARGVTIEAKSVEDNGAGIEFCVYVYNFQPGILINYKTGESKLDDGKTSPETDGGEDNGTENGGDSGTENKSTYILNTSSKKFHLPTCQYATSMKEENREEYTGTREELIENNYSPCGTCNP